MKSVKILILILSFVLLDAAGVSGQQATIEDLVKQLPADSNSLFLINGKALSDAPPAVMEKWTNNYAAANNSSPLSLPEGVQFVAMSTEFDVQHMAPLQQAVALALNKPVDAATIADVREGVVDKINGVDVVWVKDACVFVNSTNQVTVVSPLNHQSAARWLKRATAATGSSLSQYLNETAQAFVGSESQVVMAIDLSNVFSESAVRGAVERSRIFSKASHDSVTKLITSIRGVTIQCGLVLRDLFDCS